MTTPKRIYDIDESIKLIIALNDNKFHYHMFEWSFNDYEFCYLQQIVRQDGCLNDLVVYSKKFIDIDGDLYLPIFLVENDLEMAMIVDRRTNDYTFRECKSWFMGLKT